MKSRIWFFGLALLSTGCAGGSTGTSDSSPPSISITAPQDGATVNGQVSIDVTAFDDYGVDKVRIFVDNTLLVEQYTAPFHAVWNTSSLADNSAHTIKVEAVDLSKNFSTKSIGVTVSRGPS